MISIIIPVYNERARLPGLIDGLKDLKDVEIIAVDGGSSDGSADILQNDPRVHFLKSSKGRARQMNLGAQAAKGDILIFLHADCLIDQNHIGAIRRALQQGSCAGCFSQRIDSPKLIYRFIETSGNFRAKMFRIFYGDQGIFVRKDLFEDIGGFPAQDLLEDVIFSQKLKQAGKTRVLKEKIRCSPRRWEKQGILRTTLTHWLITLGFIFGVSPAKLKKLYRDIRE